LDLLSDENEDKPYLIISLASLAALNIFSGNTIEAEQYLARLRKFDAKVLDEQEEGLSHGVLLLEVLLDVFRGKNEKAIRQLAELQQALVSEEGELPQALRPLLQIADVALRTKDADPSKVTSLWNDVLKQWEEGIQERKVNKILLLLSQVQLMAGGSADLKLLRANDVESRLRRTVELARLHKSERQKVTLEGVGEVEVANSEEQSAIESANLLTGAAIVYAARKEFQEAETLFKEAISLEDQNPGTSYQDLNSIMRLAELYSDFGRRGDAENVYKKALTQRGGRWGEQSWQTLLIQELLGKLSESRGKWEEAEHSYQLVARMSQAAFGVNSIPAMGAQETLATFLFQRDRYAEAIPLFEPVIGWFESRRQSEPWFVEGSLLTDDYFQLAKSYYKVGRYDEAESAFHKGSDLISSSENTDLTRQSAALVWQWFAADALKKPEEAKRIYRDLVQLIQLEVGKPNPDESIGGELRDHASWFRDAEEYAKAEELLRLALALQEKAYGAQSLETGYVWSLLGDLDIARGQYRNAIVSLKTAQSIYEKQSPVPMFELSYVQYKIGLANYSRLDFEEARLHLTRSADLLQQARDSDNFARRQLGRVERLSGQLEAAKEIMKSVLYEREKATPPDPSGIFFALLELTSISRSQGNSEEVTQWFARAQKASAAVDPVELQDHWFLWDHERGMAALRQKKTNEAAELLRVAVEKGEKNPNLDPPLLIEYMDDYARVLRKRGKDNEAVLVEQRAKQVRERLKSEK
jgi:tetratricopeptide (TPR) repeat protein